MSGQSSADNGWQGVWRKSFVCTVDKFRRNAKETDESEHQNPKTDGLSWCFEPWISCLRSCSKFLHNRSGGLSLSNDQFDLTESNVSNAIYTPGPCLKGKTWLFSLFLGIVKCRSYRASPPQSQSGLCTLDPLRAWVTAPPGPSWIWQWLVVTAFVAISTLSSRFFESMFPAYYDLHLPRLFFSYTTGHSDKGLSQWVFSMYSSWKSIFIRIVKGWEILTGHKFSTLIVKHFVFSKSVFCEINKLIKFEMKVISPG